MNKSALGAILGAALLGFAKSKTSSSGSFGLKRNKPLEQFDAWFEKEKASMMASLDDWNFFEDRNISLMENIEKHGDFRYFTENKHLTQDQIDQLKFINDCRECPEAWFYYSFYVALCLNKEINVQIFDPYPKDSFSKVMGLSYSLSKKGLGKISSSRDSLIVFYNSVDLFIRQIKALKEISGISENSTSENILTQINSFLTSLQKNSRGLRREIKHSILSMSIVGYCYVQLLRFQISVASDKNLAEITKAAFLKLSQTSKIVSYKINSYKTVHGFEEIPMGGFNLFSPDPMPMNRSFSLGSIDMPLLDNNLLEFYSAEIFSRIWNKIEKQRPAIQKCLLDNDSRFISGSPTQKVNSFIKGIFEDNIFGLAKQIFHNVSTIIGEGKVEIDLYESYEEFWGLLSGIEQEAQEEGLDLYPAENWNDDYHDSIRSVLSEILGENHYNPITFIFSTGMYFRFIYALSSKYLEVKYSSIEDALQLYYDENIASVRLEIEEARNVANPNMFLEETISLSPEDQIIAQLPIHEVLNQDNSEDTPEIRRVLLVEYKNPKTLEEITHNTSGNLCVGRQGMAYKRSLTDGSQRHFGVLAQTDNGLSVMYHTHYTGDQMANAQFTNHNNSENFSGERGPHQEILSQAETVLNNIFKKLQ